MYRWVVSDDSTVDHSFSGPVAIRGYLQHLSGNEGYKQGRNGEDVTALFFAPVSLTLNYGDKIVYWDQTYIVLYGGESGGVAGRGTHKEIKLGAFK